MFTASRINSIIKPDKFISLNNGVYYYNYDIEEYTEKVYDIETEEVKDQTKYSYVQVRINGKPTLSKCAEEILKRYKDENNSSLLDLITLEGTMNDQIKDIYYNIRVDFKLEDPISKLDQTKKEAIRKLELFDTSVDVNSFMFNGLQVWLDKATRVGLMNSLNIEKESGKEISTLWLGSVKLEIGTDTAIQMLSDLELYALECYNKTAEHKVNIESLTTVEEVLAYDYTSGYPEKLTFNI